MKQLILICVLLISSSFFGQITTNEWKETRSVSTESVSCWNVDAFNQLFVANQSTLIKYSTDGTILYKISDKSLGEIQQIIPVTPLKILLFSEMQQRICFVDNTLTLVDACIDLSDYEIEYASHIARSGRGDKLWVFDQINSRILLIDLNQKGKIIQEIRNTKGLIEIEQLIEMIEFDSKLYLLDNTNKLTIFDLYGSLIDQRNTESHAICSSDNALWSIDSTNIFKEERENSPTVFNQIPLPGVTDFQVINNQYYFQEKNVIHIFEIVEKK
jgi:hypothetical protein